MGPGVRGKGEPGLGEMILFHREDPLYRGGLCPREEGHLLPYEMRETKGFHLVPSLLKDFID